MSGSVKIGLGVVVILGLAVGVWLAAPLFYDKEVNEALPGGLRELPEPGAVGGPAITPAPTGVGTSGAAPAQPPVGGAAAGEAGPRVLAQGSFTGFDELHQASGTARIIKVDGKNYLRFEDGFTVTNGPDLYVHLGRDGEYAAEVNLGRLKGNIGSQNYEIPDSVDLNDYNEAWVWCRAFSVPFGKAVLN